MIIIADMHICVTKFSLSPKPKRSDRGRPEQSSFPGLSASQFWDLFCQSQQPVALSFQITKYDTAVARSNQMLRSLSRGHNPYQMHSATARSKTPSRSKCTFPNRLVPTHADAKATSAGAKTRARARIKTFPKAQQTRGLSSAYQSTCLGHITSS